MHSTSAATSEVLGPAHKQPGLGPHRFQRLVRVCALFVAGVGFVALLGWFLGLPILASLGSGLIPVAPSTALLFMLYAATIMLSAQGPLAGWKHRAILLMNGVGAVIAAILFGTGLLGVQLEAEHLGFDIQHNPGKAPLGHMSPVTAFCFLLSSLSSALSLPTLRARQWTANLAAGIAACVIATGLLLVLAYLYGAPLLYGSTFIPPALLTSSAFMAIGVALFSLAAPYTWLSLPNIESGKRASYAFSLVFVLLTVGIVIAGYLYYRDHEIHYRAEIARQLTAIADLKMDGLINWRKERMGDAALFYKNANFSGLVKSYLQRPDDGDTARKLRIWLQHVQHSYAYDRVFLLDAVGKKRMVEPDDQRPRSRTAIQSEAEALRARKIIFQDFYRNEQDGRVYLAIFVPLFDEQDHGRALGTLVLRIDPEQYLYPFLNRWPTSSETAETLLVRRDGSDVLFLNALRFKKDAALNLRRSLDQAELLAAQAVLGKQGIMEGRDYRGVPVIADLRAVPGTPWFLVSRMDVSEIYGPMREKLWTMVVLVVALLIGSGAAFGMVWRQQLSQFYQARYEATCALQESDANLKEAQTMAQLGHWKWDVKTGSVEWSEEVYKIFRLDPKTFVPQIDSIQSLSPWPEDHERDKELIQKAMESHDKGEYEQRFLRPDGSTGYYYSTFRGKYDDAGDLTSIVGTVQDITERKRAEEALRANAHFLQTLMDAIPNPIFYKDIHGVYQGCNAAFEAYLGKDKSRIIGTSVYDVAPKELADQYHEKDIALLRQGGVQVYESSVKYADGTLHDVIFNKARFTNADGSPGGLVGVILDVTELKQLEAKLESLIADLQRSNRELEQFAYVASHDLQEPLRMVASYTQLLGERYKNQLDDKARLFIHYAVDGATRMQLLINDLLMYSRVGTRGKPLEPIDAHAVLGEAIKNLKMNIDETKAIITNDELPTVRADASQLAQVFQNLIGNSLKFLGTEPPRIHVSAKDKGKEWLFSIKDNGIGIEPQYADKVFVIFQRLHTKEEYSGSGIGLAICKKIVERHGGKIWFESEPGKGTTFYFTIPK